MALPGRPPTGGTPSQAASEAGSLSFNMAGASESVTVGAWHSKLPDRDMATCRGTGILSGDGPCNRPGWAGQRDRSPLSTALRARTGRLMMAPTAAVPARPAQSGADVTRVHWQLLSGGPASGPGPFAKSHNKWCLRAPTTDY